MLTCYFTKAQVLGFVELLSTLYDFPINSACVYILYGSLGLRTEKYNKFELTLARAIGVDADRSLIN